MLRPERSTLSIVVLTYNNAGIIGRLLGSVAWADEIVVVDSGSTDKTREIAEGSHPRVTFLSRGLDSFAAQRNFGMEHATMDWVCHCDSDNVFTAELSKEVQDLLQNAARGQASAAAWNTIERFFWFDSRLSFIDGPWGGRVKLHRRGSCKFAGSIHEAMEFSGSIGMLHAPILHRCDQSINQLIRKYLLYSDREARAAIKGEKQLSISPLMMFARPFKRLVGFLIVKKAYKDGLPGVIWAFLQALALFLTYVKFQVLRRGITGLADASDA